uniref:Uncharacterized protein n=1 Tax=Acrobeloides nanus TaxID=290746 RepID=A0A914E196_9BILA
MLRNLATITWETHKQPPNSPPEFQEPREKVLKYYDKVIHQSDSNVAAVKPTEAEKKLLVLTGVFSSKDQIPENVGAAAMHKLNNRIRIFVFASIVVFSYFLTKWYLKARDRRQGVPELKRSDYKPLPRKLVEK